jgi:phospholipase C
MRVKRGSTREMKGLDGSNPPLSANESGCRGNLRGTARNDLNALEKLPQWQNMAIVIAWDDSDGDYDHQMSPIFNGSTSAVDALNGPGICGSGNPVLGDAESRCGYGPRLPLLIISPYAKPNFVDHSITDQTSILRFIEDNWSLGSVAAPTTRLPAR